MPLIPLKNWKTPRRVAQSTNHQVAALLAPTSGLNLRDPFLTLKPQDALVLNNFIARPQGCETRGGYKKHSVGLGGKVATLLGYEAQDPTESKLFAAVEDKFFDVTEAEEDPDPIVADTGSADGYWSSIMFNGPTRNFLCCTNKTGGYWTYDTVDGWVDRTADLTGFSGAPGCIAAWKNRLFFIDQGTAKAYYLPVNSIQGAASELDLGPLLKHGGSLVAVTNWTLNAGIDIDDYIVFFGSEGDVIVYQGTDPDDISTFALKGVWYLGRPMAGDRFFTEYGGELFVMSELGMVPLSKMVNGLVADTYSVMTSKIQPALTVQTAKYIDAIGWEVGISATNDLVIIQTPQGADGTYLQWVMFIQTGAWSTFTGMPMTTWVVYNGQLYFGDENGNVCKGLYKDKDGVEFNETGGDLPLCSLQGGFNDFGVPANLKIFSMVRPIFISSTAPAVSLQINIDYMQNKVYAQPVFFDVDASFWDEAVWNEATWSGDAQSYSAWAGVQGMGYYGSLRMAVRGKQGTSYASSNVMYQVGGVM